MFDPKFFDDIAKRLSDAIPTSVKNLQEDMERNFRGILQAAFAKLDLVTRDEFDVQANVLARTRSKLESLEKRLHEIEQLSAETTPQSNVPIKNTKLSDKKASDHN
ncbi:accessory factor UbiK family protein [soil metagenome]